MCVHSFLTLYVKEKKSWVLEAASRSAAGLTLSGEDRMDRWIVMVDGPAESM